MPTGGWEQRDESPCSLERRFDLTGTHLRISTIAYEPYTFLDEDNENNRTYRGLMMDVVKYIQTKGASINDVRAHSRVGGGYW